jgi:ribonucleoside-diphosphate reductase alpha chain
MGLGVTGMANAIEALGHPYGSEDFVKTEASILSEIANEAYEASAQLAQEKGSFPMYDPHSYLEAPFIKQLDPGVQTSIRRFGVRNSHLTSIAPTGTISICADNVSSSIEPVFAYHQRRKIYMPSGLVETDFDDYGFRVFGVRGKRSLEVTMDEHLAVLACATKYVDSAVSKTCNVPIDTPWEAFKGLYMRAWRLNCKGLTTYQVGGKRAGIITSEDDPAKESTCRIDVKTGRHECD